MINEAETTRHCSFNKSPFVYGRDKTLLVVYASLNSAFCTVECIVVRRIIKCILKEQNASEYLRNSHAHNQP